MLATKQALRNRTWPYRFFATAEPDPVSILERWLQGWAATPEVPRNGEGGDSGDAPGGPTAVSWLRRRGFELPESTIHRLFREEQVRVFDSSTGQVKRIRKHSTLPAGSRLLIPRHEASLAKLQGRQPGQSLVNSRFSKTQLHNLARQLRDTVIIDLDNFMAINKPNGLAVQGGSDVYISVDNLLSKAFPEYSCTKYSALTASKDALSSYQGLRLVHRLDKDASGVLLLAKGADSAARLGAAFRTKSRETSSTQERTAPGLSFNKLLASKEKDSSGDATIIDKVYWAIVCKHREVHFSSLKAKGTIITTDSESGKQSTTHFKVLKESKQLAWLELQPVTGRKHQLRTHCAEELGTAILGDSKFGALREEPQKAFVGEVKRLMKEEIEEVGFGSGGVPLFLHCRKMKVGGMIDGLSPVVAVAEVPEIWKRVFGMVGWDWKRR